MCTISGGFGSNVYLLFAARLLLLGLQNCYIFFSRFYPPIAIYLKLSLYCFFLLEIVLVLVFCSKLSSFLLEKYQVRASFDCPCCLYITPNHWYFVIFFNWQCLLSKVIDILTNPELYLINILD